MGFAVGGGIDMGYFLCHFVMYCVLVCCVCVISEVEGGGGGGASTETG